MSIYVHVTLDLKAEGLGRFCEVMAQAVTILAAEGWRLHAALVQRTGRLNTVIDIWELESFDHFDRALQAFRQHPAFASIKAVLDDVTLNETVVFAQDAPYAHPRE